MSNSFSDKEIGKRIHELRKSAMISQVTFSEYLDISVSHLRLIENGERGTKISRYVAIARIFNVSLDYLVTGGCEFEQSPIDGSIAIYEKKLGEHDLHLLGEIAEILSIHKHNQTEVSMLCEALQFQLKFLHTVTCWER